MQEICDAIRACGDRADNPDYKYGYGIPDFSKAVELLHVAESEDASAPIISLYPNPTQGDVHVVLNGVREAELTVYDITGRRLYAYSFNGLNNTNLERYLNTLGQGVYFINVVSEAGNQTQKLVVTK